MREKKRSFYQRKLKELAENPIFGRRFSTEQLLKSAELSKPDHLMDLLAKAGGDPKRAARMAEKELREEGLVW